MKIKKLVLMAALALCVALAVLSSIVKVSHNGATLVMGAKLHERIEPDKAYSKATFKDEDRILETDRFQRPSRTPAYMLKYTFNEPDSTSDQGAYIPKEYPKAYESSSDVIEAYYSIVKAASNMSGFQGGCGTVNWSIIPYPYAYELLSDKTKGKVNFKQFESSFRGVGTINLLKLIPAYTPSETPKNINFHMVEIEVIGGVPATSGSSDTRKPSFFSYYYGLVITAYEEGKGWKIVAIDYLPEDFLCAPWHLWSWDSRAVVEIVYKEWYKLIDTIQKVELKYPYVIIYAKNKQGSLYRFDFVRLTNGEDIMLRENIKQNGKWVETNLLKAEHQYFKNSILSPYYR